MKKTLKTRTLRINKLNINKYKKTNKKKQRLAGTKKYTKTINGNYEDLVLSSETPLNIRKLSNKIARRISSNSYSPTINRELISLKSITREKIDSCNLEQASNGLEPLKIYKKLNNECIPYYDKEAIKILLKNLKANKHINAEKIITPIQYKSNCWFNVLFVTFFVSDKGRKFFHFLRQFMINRVQKDKKNIPNNLKDAFALLNFAIEQCLIGSKLAYELDTNIIIKSVYQHIPETYKSKQKYLTNIDEAGNPILYYSAIINYLNNSSIQLLFVEQASLNWKDVVSKNVEKMTHLPHIIVLEVTVEDAAIFNKKPVSFTVDNAKYEIDSASIIDISRQHFCATITCENKEMAYDGASFHRLVPLNWKHKLNSDFSWEFEGTYERDNLPMKWNFTKCYQLLMYYRVK